MRDLVYSVSKGDPASIKDGVVTHSIDSSDRPFSVHVFGNVLVGKEELKSPLFPIRNLIAVAHCYYLGVQRDNVRDVASNNALCVIESIDRTLLDNPIIIIEGIRFDCSDDEGKEVLKNLYVIMRGISLTYSQDKPPVVYWDLLEEEIAFMMGIPFIGCDCHITDTDEYRCLVLHS